MNARTTNSIARITALVFASLTLPAAALAADSPKPESIDIDGATCRDADEKDVQAPAPLPPISAFCALDGSTGMSWDDSDGALGYQITTYADYGDGFELVSRFETIQNKMPIGGGDAGFYIVTIQSIDEAGNLADAVGSLGLRFERTEAPDGSDDERPADGSDATADADADTQDPSPQVDQDEASLEARIAALEAELDEVLDAAHEAWDAADALRHKNAKLISNQRRLNARIRQVSAENTQLKKENGVLKRILRGLITGTNFQRPSPR